MTTLPLDKFTFYIFFSWSIICTFKLFNIYIFVHRLTFVFSEELIILILNLNVD